MPGDSIWDSRPGPSRGSSPYTPPTGGAVTPAMEALAKQLVVRNSAYPYRIIRAPEIPGLNARAARPFIPMIQTGSGRPIIDIAGRDPATWNAARGTAQQINAAQAQNAAAIAERMAAYNAARPVSQPVSTSRPIIQVGTGLAGMIGRGGARLFGR